MPFCWFCHDAAPFYVSSVLLSTEITSPGEERAACFDGHLLASPHFVVECFSALPLVAGGEKVVHSDSTSV